MILSVLFVLISSFTYALADDFVEDVYYWDDSYLQQQQLVPSYNPRAKEIIFIEDSVSAQHPDTVRAILREAPR